VTIRNGGALRDVAHAPDDPRTREHRLAERCLPGRRVTHQGKIAKVPCRRRGHNSSAVPALKTPRIRRGRKLKSQRAVSGRCGPMSRRWRTPPLSERQRHEKRKAPRDDGWSSFNTAASCACTAASTNGSASWEQLRGGERFKLSDLFSSSELRAYCRGVGRGRGAGRGLGVGANLGHGVGAGVGPAAVYWVTNIRASVPSEPMEVRFSSKIPGGCV
jgi:hypothetical protein